MPIVFMLFLYMSSLMAEDFITPFEYGKMLYQNPRGIGCDKCHGIRGGGQIIARYEEGNQTKQLVAPAIYNLTRVQFLNKVNKKSKVMPTYFLTSDEIKSLYYYINEVNKK